MDKIRLPMNMEDAKALATVLSNYKDDYFFTVVLAFFYTYVLYPFHGFIFMLQVEKNPIQFEWNCNSILIRTSFFAQSLINSSRKNKIQIFGQFR